MSERENDPERLAPESYLMLINYRIIISENWNLFKADFSFKEKGNKDSQLDWFPKLNKIRNKVSHPERGNATKDDLIFLNTIWEKISVLNL